MLSFFVLFSIVDLSVLNLLSNLNFNVVSETSISQVMAVQYDILQQTKNVVANVCNNIAKDVMELFSPTQKNLVFFNVDKENKPYIDNYLNYVKLLLSVVMLKVSFFVFNQKKILFFFLYIFLYILKYLGLLFTFGKKEIINLYKKAYSM